MCPEEQNDAYWCVSSEGEGRKLELCQRAQKNSWELVFLVMIHQREGKEVYLENGAVKTTDSLEIHFGIVIWGQYQLV